MILENILENVENFGAGASGMIRTKAGRFVTRKSLQGRVVSAHRKQMAKRASA